MSEVSDDHKLRVFLCHAKEDKEAVRALHDRLRDSGFAPWLDEIDILPGQQWEHEIRRAVRSADVVLVCLSTHSEKRGYVQKEITLALDVADQQPEGTIFLVPAKLQPCTMPDRLTKWQWVSLFEDNGYSLLEQALRQRLASHHTRGEGQEPKGPRVLVVDDHAVVRRGVRDILTEGLGEVAFGEASNSRQALEKMEHERWDLVLLDLGLPGRGGLDALRTMKRLYPKVPVLVLSMHAEDHYALRSLRAGAAGYVNKEGANEVLVAAVRKVLAGGTHVSASLAETLAQSLGFHTSRPAYEDLSDRELEVVRGIASGHPRDLYLPVISITCADSRSGAVV